ncbi:MAG TPA: alanine racemase, partial [Steroidobacteraceae bacterium]|nr:alanine racemase [Steroidobacteraceae bacterium]
MTLSFPLHAPTPYFSTRDGHLVIGGHTVAELARAVDRTPIYVYDRAVMTRKVQELRAVLPREVEVHYAMKANPMPAVVKHFAGIVDGIDLASAAEMDVALAAGMAPGLLSFAGPGKRPEELERAVAAGVVINMESFREMHRIAEIARRTGTRPKVAVRVNPDFELKNSGMKMAGGPKQFGVDAEQVPQLLQELRDLPLEFWGFHIYSGSQNLRPEVLVDAQRKTAALAIELSQHALSPVRSLNLGGGFGIPYFPGEKPLDLAPIGANLHELLPEIRRALPEASVALELGRFLVGEAGVYVCRVIDRKVSRGQVFLVTDGGLHHHLAASGNF